MAGTMTITYQNKEYPVTEGFTAAEMVESMAVAMPELTNAKLIDDGGGKFTVKALTGTNG